MTRSPALGAYKRLLVPIAVAVAAVACGEEGTTPKCPAAPLYDIREYRDGGDPELDDERAAAEASGCLMGRGQATSAGGTSGDGG